MNDLLHKIGPYAVAMFVVGIPIYGVIKKVKVYEAFIEGAKEGFQVAVRIIPYLVAILSVIGAFRKSGAMDYLSQWLGPVTEKIGVPAATIPLMIVRPLSGGASRGILADLLNTYGPDTYIGRVASVMSGCTETTFYVLAVYCGAVGVSRYRQALATGIVADLSGFAAAVVITLLFFGR